MSCNKFDRVVESKQRDGFPVRVGEKWEVNLSNLAHLISAWETESGAHNSEGVGK